jgi:DNA polymerase-1
MQLVSSSIGLVNPGETSLRVWTQVEVRDKTGVSPDQIVDWLSLVGDAVDNIPGAPGIGPKTASKLLAEFGSVEEMLRRVTEVKPERFREVLVGSQAIIERNRRLIRLDTQVPVDMAWERFASPKGEAGAVHVLYREWGFRVKAEIADAADRQETEQDLFAA